MNRSDGPEDRSSDERCFLNALPAGGVTRIVESWRQQPGTPVYGPNFVASEVQGALSQASRERPVEFRAEERKGTFA